MFGVIDITFHAMVGANNYQNIDQKYKRIIIQTNKSLFFSVWIPFEFITDC